MLLFLALASLTTLNHVFLNQFITKHRDTFSSTKISRDDVSVSFTHITECHIKDDTIYYCWLLLLRYLWANYSWSLPLDIYGQVIVVYPTECIRLHCCFTLQVNTDALE